VAILSLPTLQPPWFQHVDRVSRSTLGVGDVSGPRLARAVAHVSQLYTRERLQLSKVAGDDEALCARLKFFLSRDLLKIHGPIAELASVRAFPARRQLRVLDVGAGLGATSVGLSRTARALDLVDSIALTAIDVDGAALEILELLCADLESLPGVPITVTCHELDIRKGLGLSRAARFDVILLGLSLNELSLAGEGAAATLISLSEHLSEDGVIVVLEPAVRETSRALHATRDQLAARDASPYVFAPCLHRKLGCPMLQRERDHCHERVPCVLPEPLAEIARGARLRDTALTYSYLTLHRQSRSLLEVSNRDSGATALRAVSGSLASKGKIELWLCGETLAPRGMRLDRHEAPENAAFERADRGSILRIEPAATPEEASRLRIGASARVELHQHWELSRDTGAVAQK
jgi:SAM-dependent methyltransferase